MPKAPLLTKCSILGYLRLSRGIFKKYFSNYENFTPSARI